jgi:hypothetical protein
MAGRLAVNNWWQAAKCAQSDLLNEVRHATTTADGKGVKQLQF